MENVGHITSEIASRIAAAIGGDVSHSRQSASAYVDACIETSDDESINWCCRISDHEARSYNRDGNFMIFVGDLAKNSIDHHHHVRAVWIEEEIEREIEIDDVDEDGNDITRIVTETDKEYRFDYDAEAIEDAVAAAVAAFDRATANRVS